jgi:hypothetical protein
MAKRNAAPAAPAINDPGLAPYHSIIGPLHAAPLSVWGNAYDIADTTLWELRKKGQGPRTFKIGRKLYATRSAWVAWLDQMAADGMSDIDV